MLTKIIQFSIRNKLLIGLGIVALIVAGIINVTRLPIDALPDITSNQVQVITTSCLLYTSDAADERSSVDLGGRRIIKKKKSIEILQSRHSTIDKTESTNKTKKKR